MENSKNWPKDIPFSLLFHTGYHFRGNSSPHLCWMVVAMGSWIESLAELSYFCFALAHFGFDWTLPVDHTASTTLDTEGLASRGDEFLLPSFGTLVDCFVGDSVIVNWLLLVHGWIIEARFISCTIDGRGTSTQFSFTAGRIPFLWWEKMNFLTTNICCIILQTQTGNEQSC